MVLYNVNFYHDLDNLLIPRIPYSTAIGEDSETERICLSDSIEGCITAIAPANRPLTVGSNLIVKEVNVTDFSYLFYPEYLYSEGLVPDALENREYWYLDEICANVRQAVIQSFDYSMDLAWTCIKASEVAAIAYQLCNKNFYGETSKDVYEQACDFFTEHGMWDEFDAIYDRLSELPWAQRVVVSNLKLKYI